MECIFCKIVKKEQPADISYEDENIVAFKDINPKAKIHLLIVSKKHIDSVMKLQDENRELAGEMILVAKKIAEQKGLDKTGYKLIFNCGKGGGQIIEHIHLHLLGGNTPNPKL